MSSDLVWTEKSLMLGRKNNQTTKYASVASQKQKDQRVASQNIGN